MEREYDNDSHARFAICDGSRERVVVSVNAILKERREINSKIEQFDKDNTHAKFYLGSLVEPQHVHVIKPALAKEGWLKLHQMFDTATRQRLATCYVLCTRVQHERKRHNVRKSTLFI